MSKQLLRGIANSLWPHLKLGQWRRSTRNLAPTHAHFSTRASQVDKAPSLSQTITVAEWVDALLLSEEWPGGASFGIRLEREDYDRALNALPAEAVNAYEALKRTPMRKPFTLTPNRHGAVTLRRSSAEPMLTALAVLVLERVAGAATLQTVDELTVDDFLIGDADVHWLFAVPS